MSLAQFLQLANAGRLVGADNNVERVDKDNSVSVNVEELGC